MISKAASHAAVVAEAAVCTNALLSARLLLFVEYADVKLLVEVNDVVARLVVLDRDGLLDGLVLSSFIILILLSLSQMSILLLVMRACLLLFEAHEVNLVLGPSVEGVELKDICLGTLDAEVLSVRLPDPVHAAGHP